MTDRARGSIALAAEMALDLVDPPAGEASDYFDRPADFVREVFRFDGEETGPTAYQTKALEELIEHGRLCVRAPHTAGKTTMSAWSVLWFALTRDARGMDWKIITTASAWRQLERYLWPEIRKWTSRIRWGVLGREPFRPGDMMRLGLRLTHGEAFAAACDEPASIEGAHADALYYLFDESKTIPGATFDAAEGAFAGAGEHTAQEAFALAVSTPGLTSGRFYEIQSRKPGYEDWHVTHWSKDEIIESGRMERDWAKQKLRQWGEDSAIYQQRVEGNFADADDDGVIKLEWAEQAVARWEGLPMRDGVLDADEVPLLTAVGADIAEAGGDQTVLAPRHGMIVREIVVCPRGDVMQATGHIVAELRGREKRPPAVVDAIGLGAGVVPRLREQGYEAVPFKASEKTEMRDESQQMEFASKRDAALWRLRDLLDPANGHEVALPPDDELIGDLTAARWWLNSAGKVKTESKDELRERLGRSPDKGDAVMMAFWVNPAESSSPPRVIPSVSRWSPMGEAPRPR